MSESIHPVELQNASLEGFGQTLLEPTNWQLQKGRVTVLIGPAGTGKTALMRATAGRDDQDLRRRGHWQFRGKPYASNIESRVCFVPQADTAKRRSLEEVVARVQPRDVLLLDEPDHGLSDHELDQLAERLAEWKRVSAVLVVTHNLQFARQVGDDVTLLAAGRFWAHGKLSDVFANPPNDMTRRFLEQGNCWPGPPPVALPKHFSWLIEGQVAGMGKPGLIRAANLDLEAIALAGITQLVSLTMQPFPSSVLSGFGIEGRHFPIQDMGIPSVGNTVRLCRGIERALNHDGRVAVHCHAGLGRTGTILASYLIYRGSEPEAAITRVRTINPKYIQSEAQLEFLRRFTG